MLNNAANVRFPECSECGARPGQAHDPLCTIDRPIACRYFLMCDQEAIGTLPNPIIGPVPVCLRCATTVGAADRITPFSTTDRKDA